MYLLAKYDINTQQIELFQGLDVFIRVGAAGHSQGLNTLAPISALCLVQIPLLNCLLQAFYKI